MQDAAAGFALALSTTLPLTFFFSIVSTTSPASLR
jgi:hypothetical protein